MTLPFKLDTKNYAISSLVIIALALCYSALLMITGNTTLVRIAPLVTIILSIAQIMLNHERFKFISQFNTIGWRLSLGSFILSIIPNINFVWFLFLVIFHKINLNIQDIIKALKLKEGIDYNLENISTKL